jgi:hypothetical protein
MPVEVANILRRAMLAGDVTDDVAALAHADLLALRVELFPYEAVAPRAWELRANLTAYDACYVALAEALRAPRHARPEAGARCGPALQVPDATEKVGRRALDSAARYSKVTLSR